MRNIYFATVFNVNIWNDQMVFSDISYKVLSHYIYLFDGRGHCELLLICNQNEIFHVWKRCVLDIKPIDIIINCNQNSANKQIWKWYEHVLRRYATRIKPYIAHQRKTWLPDNQNILPHLICCPKYDWI